MSVRFFVLFSTAVALTGSGCSSGDLKDVFGNEQAMATVKNATSVKAYRLQLGSYYQESLSDYKIADGPVYVSDDIASRLSKILLDASIYEWDSAKLCEPDYGVRIQFSEGDNTVDVLFCFECDILAVYHNGRPVGGEDFDDARSRLVSIVQKLFPNDEIIQSLE
jgi:hypothetical protein